MVKSKSKLVFWIKKLAKTTNYDGMNVKTIMESIKEKMERIKKLNQENSFQIKMHEF